MDRKDIILLVISLILGWIGTYLTIGYFGDLGDFGDTGLLIGSFILGNFVAIIIWIIMDLIFND